MKFKHTTSCLALMGLLTTLACGGEDSTTLDHPEGRDDAPLQTTHHPIVFGELELASPLDELYLGGMSTDPLERKIEYTLSRRLQQTGEITNHSCHVPMELYDREMSHEERLAICTACAYTRTSSGTSFLTNWNTVLTADHVVRPRSKEATLPITFDLPYLPGDRSASSDRGDYHLAQQLYSLGYPSLGRHEVDLTHEPDAHGIRQSLRTWDFYPYTSYARRPGDIDAINSRDIAMLKTLPRVERLSTTGRVGGLKSLHWREPTQATAALQTSYLNLPGPGVLFGQHDMLFQLAIEQLIQDELFDHEIYGAFIHHLLPVSYVASYPDYPGADRSRSSLSRPGYFSSQELYTMPGTDEYGVPAGQFCNNSYGDDITQKELNSSCATLDNYQYLPDSDFVTSHDIWYRHCARTSLDTRSGNSGGGVLTTISRDYTPNPAIEGADHTSYLKTIGVLHGATTGKNGEQDWRYKRSETVASATDFSVISMPTVEINTEASRPFRFPPSPVEKLEAMAAEEYGAWFDVLPDPEGGRDIWKNTFVIRDKDNLNPPAHCDTTVNPACVGITTGGGTPHTEDNLSTCVESGELGCDNKGYYGVGETRRELVNKPGNMGSASCALYYKNMYTSFAALYGAEEARAHNPYWSGYAVGIAGNPILPEGEVSHDTNALGNLGVICAPYGGISLDNWYNLTVILARSFWPHDDPSQGILVLPGNFKVLNQWGGLLREMLEVGYSVAYRGQSIVAQDVTLSWNTTPEATRPDALRPIKYQMCPPGKVLTGLRMATSPTTQAEQADLDQAVFTYTGVIAMECTNAPYDTSKSWEEQTVVLHPFAQDSEVADYLMPLDKTSEFVGNYFGQADINTQDQRYFRCSPGEAITALSLDNIPWSLGPYVTKMSTTCTDLPLL